MWPTENGIYSPKSLTRMFTAAWFITAPDWKQFQWLSTADPTNTLWSIQILCSSEGEWITTTGQRWIWKQKGEGKQPSTTELDCGVRSVLSSETGKRNPWCFNWERVVPRVGWGTGRGLKLNSRVLATFPERMLMTQAGSICEKSRKLYVYDTCAFLNVLHFNKRFKKIN